MNKFETKYYASFKPHWLFYWIILNLYLNPRLKTLNTIGNCQRQVFSNTWCISTYRPYMHKITNLCSIGHQSCEITMNEKHPGHTKLCAIRCLILRPQTLTWGLEIKFVEKLLLSRKTTLLQREPFLTMFYIINLSPLLVTK